MIGPIRLEATYIVVKKCTNKEALLYSDTFQMATLECAAGKFTCIQQAHPSELENISDREYFRGTKVYASWGCYQPIRNTLVSSGSN